MKVVLSGIAIILFGMAIILAFSSTGLAYSDGTVTGLWVAGLGLLVSVTGNFIGSGK
ncbi:hypothetical protein HF072_06245 [Bacillus sp. RO3]|nr:hypothetical protein [Bacillus sp. RO3]